jgi:hypothetical protein
MDDAPGPITALREAFRVVQAIGAASALRGSATPESVLDRSALTRLRLRRVRDPCA